jgi:hypothetical protein
MKNTAHRTVGRLITAILALSAAATSQAAMVTYEATGQISQADNAAQLPTALTAAGVGGQLSVDFTVDTNAAGTLNAPGDESYGSAVVSQSASIGSGTVTLGANTVLNQIEIFNNSLAGGLYTSGYQLTSFGNAPTDFTGSVSSLIVGTDAVSANPQAIYQNTSLSNAPLSSSAANGLDAIVLEFSSYLNGVFQSASDIVVGTNVTISNVGSGHFAAPEIDTASTTSALTLLMGSLIVITGRRQKAR